MWNGLKKFLTRLIDFGGEVVDVFQRVVGTDVGNWLWTVGRWWALIGFVIAIAFGVYWLRNG
jgi:hypothetical protein